MSAASSSIHLQVQSPSRPVSTAASTASPIDDPPLHRRPTLRPPAEDDSRSNMRIFTLRRAASALMQPERKIGAAPTIWQSWRRLILGSWINVLLVFVPIMFATRYTTDDPRQVFAFSFLALLPVAKLFGLAMEELAIRVGAVVGRFIRVLAGNMVELISGVIAIMQCQLPVLQASLVGSILINILLVLGVAFFVGGTRFAEQGFSMTPTQISSHLLTLSTVAVLLPTLFAVSLGQSTEDDVLRSRMAIVKISRAVAIAFIMCYFLFALFQLWSHIYLLQARSEMKSTKFPKRKGERERPDLAEVASNMSIASNTVDVEADAEADAVDELDEEEEMPQMSVHTALIAIAVTVALIAALSEYFVSALGSLTFHDTLSPQWIGLILIPLIGTLARHDLLEAASFGAKDRMDESISLTIGSSVNLALFVQPILILLSWILGKHLTLLFDPFESMALFLCVLTVNFVLDHAKSNWFLGVILIVLYCLIAITFWFYPGTHVFAPLIWAC